MDITPTKAYLDDLQKRFRQIVDGDYVPMGPADLFVILKALNEAIARWRPVAGLTLSELREAVEQQKSIGAAAWAPILATCKLSPSNLARAVRDCVNKPAEEQASRGDAIFLALEDAFGDLADWDL